MKRFSLCSDISFVTDHNKLVVLNFETGEYFTVDGICKEILIMVDNNKITEEELLQNLMKIYDQKNFDIETSLRHAIEVLLNLNFIITI